MESQETRCRQYATAKGYDIAAVFPDTFSGGGDFMQRPGMVALLSFLDAQPHENFVVIFDDLKRFARDREFHFLLRDSFRKRGAQVECLNFRFEDTPEGEFIETILAAQGQLERKQNGRQVSQKMKARLESGYWVFAAPQGYTYERVAGHGKLLVRDEPVASIIQEALEGFAAGRFETQSEVKYFLEQQPAFPKDTPSGAIRYEKIIRLMSRIAYTGHVEYSDWDVSLRKGHHQPIISMETFDAIQQRLKEGSRPPFRKDISADFPLRGFITCDDCGTSLTSCWSTSKSGAKHPYYLCHSKGCESYRKSIRRDVIEGAFAGLIKDLQPTEGLFAVTKRMFKDAWGNDSNRRMPIKMFCEHNVGRLRNKSRVFWTALSRLTVEPSSQPMRNASTHWKNKN
ncbi:recombinase family protein [Octadecabacter ascidiaceicola]|uniref:Recombinase domain-containing protein n=1 Tax=Octadecabacter ascidiaceicola TaxID=1655543 RepID=A0A238JK04_9RHOB|nr:recombinase family protein [Octadecabacter ascidiaceicola]SMX30815.1 hypothetical protein OCA8868_00045 [Octadecabacter ascidiaceicola]